MGATVFNPKASRDKFFATEVNAIYAAINNLENAIGIIVGTSNAAIRDTNIVDLDASKLKTNSSASIANLVLSQNLEVQGTATLKGVTTLGPLGLIKVTNAASKDIIKLGAYGTDLHGLIVSDGTNTNLFIDDNGTVTLRGTVSALPGSIFSGQANITEGSISNNVVLGDTNGIVLDGQNQRIIIGINGVISAGFNTLTSTGFTFNAGSININNNFVVTESGAVTIANGNYTGAVTMTSGIITATGGQIGNLDISGTGISTGGVGSTTTGFSLEANGAFYAKQANITGEVHVVSGDISGQVNILPGGKIVTKDVIIDDQRATFTNLELHLGEGKFSLVDGTLTASSAHLSGEFNLVTGNFEGTISVGNETNLQIDGTNKKIVAGTTELTSTGLSFKQGSIKFGTGINGPTGEKLYRFFVDDTGYLQASEAVIDGYFSGEFQGKVTTNNGLVGGWYIGSNGIFAENTTDATPTGTIGEESRSKFILNSAGFIEVYSDRIGLGDFNSDVKIAEFGLNGLKIINGCIDVTTAIDTVNDRSLLINSSGIISRSGSFDKVVIDGGGISLIKGGINLGYIITPDGLQAGYLADGSIVSSKLSTSKPRFQGELVLETSLIQYATYDVATITVTWTIPLTKDDGTEFNDGIGYRIYLKRPTDITFRCIATADPAPDYPEVTDPGDPRYMKKSYLIDNLLTNTSYMVGVTALDKLGNETSKCIGSITTAKDATPPNSIAPGDIYGAGGTKVIFLSWKRSMAIDLARYVLERCESDDNIVYTDWEPLTETIANIYVDKTVSTEKYYKYRWKLVDRSGNESAWTELPASLRATGFTPDDIGIGMLEGKNLKDLTITADKIADNMITSNKLYPDIQIAGIFSLAQSTITLPWDSKFVKIVANDGAATPTTEPRGLAARQLFIGGDYDLWNSIFGSTTPMLPDEPGCAYLSKHLYVVGDIIVIGTVDGVKVSDFRDAYDTFIATDYANTTSRLSQAQSDISALQTAVTNLTTSGDNISSRVTAVQNQLDEHKADTTSHLSSNEKDALVGTNGAPSATNKFVTDSDTRLHNRIHNIVSSDHTATGLIAGNVLKALSDTTFGFEPLKLNEIPCGGEDTQVQFNDGGVLAGSGGLTFDKIDGTLIVAGNLITNGLDIRKHLGGYPNQGYYSITTYRLLAVLPALDYNHVVFEITGGGHTSSEKYSDRFIFGNQNGFYYFWDCFGSAEGRGSVAVQAYQQVDGSVHIYLALSGLATYNINGYGTTGILVPGPETTTPPTGALIFTSGDRATYPPTFAYTSTSLQYKGDNILVNNQSVRHESFIISAGTTSATWNHYYGSPNYVVLLSCNSPNVSVSWSNKVANSVDINIIDSSATPTDITVDVVLMPTT